MAKLTKTPIKVEKKVEKITYRLIFPNSTIELTQEEADDLYAQLTDLLGKNTDVNKEVIKNIQKIFEEKKSPKWQEPWPPYLPPIPSYPCPDPYLPYKPYERILCGFATKDTTIRDL